MSPSERATRVISSGRVGSESPEPDDEDRCGSARPRRTGRPPPAPRPRRTGGGRPRPASSQCRHRRRVRHAVSELEQLHRELDVGQRAAAELEVELRVVAGRDPLLLDAHLHAPHLALLGGAQGPLPHGGLDPVDEPAPELGVAGHVAHAQVRLPLPGRRPPVEVARPSPRGCGPAGRCVPRVGGRRRRPRCARRGCPRRRTAARPLATRSASSDVGSLVDERQVEVAGVAELGAAEAPERDHRERELRVEGAERRLEAGLARAGSGRRRPARRWRGRTRRGRPRRGGDAASIAAARAGGRARPSRHEMALSPLVTRSSHGLVRRRSGSGSRSMRSGLATSTSPSWRLVPSRRARWRATSGESRNAMASAVERCSPDARRRSPSRPRSGSGEADSQSSSSGRSCCIIRDERVRPRVSSVDGLAGALDVREPEGREPLRGGDLAERADAGQRGQQRPEPHPLVDRADTRPVAGQLARRRPRSDRRPATPGSRARGPRGGAGRGPRAPCASAARPRAAARARRGGGTGRSRRARRRRRDRRSRPWRSCVERGAGCRARGARRRRARARAGAAGRRTRRRGCRPGRA